MAGVNVEKGNLLSLTGDLDVEEYTRKDGSKTKIVKVTILYQNYSLIGAKKENEEKFASSQECYFSEYNDYGILFYLKKRVGIASVKKKWQKENTYIKMVKPILLAMGKARKIIYKFAEYFGLYIRRIEK